MASLVLGVAGAAVGPSLFGAGFSVFGAAITGAQIGGALGAALGSQIDAALAPGRHVHREGPRLSDVKIQSSTEGAAIPRVFGRMRVAGQLIWATNFKETATTTETRSGGKGGPSVTATDTEYSYSVSFAVGLCEGVVTRIGRVWADGTPLDLSGLAMRFYPGDETQSADPLIVETEGEGNTPAHRGLCYVVFEDLPLAQFGNRIPQLQFEVIRSLSADRAGSLENALPGVAMIPAAGEFVYATDIVTNDNGEGATTPENAHNAAGTADISASLDDLQALAPNARAVSLVVGWFGNDLRAGHIAVRPGVEMDDKITYPQVWSVNGVARADAHLVSRIDGRPAYGGTPSDESVVQAIAALKARGFRVLFYPFLFMDVAAGNDLTDPYSGTAGQPAYPWRGRITCDPAPGVSGTPSTTATAAAQVAAFFGAAQPEDFSISGTNVRWSGGDDWGWRRMVLHYAHLCAAAGGVDAFLIGSEFVALNSVRDGAASFPAIAAWRDLAGDVRAILGSETRISYGADWSEYNNHQTGDAPGELFFHLDPLWADDNIDFVGIDNYLPLSDWREGTGHADYNAVSGPISDHDGDYLAANIRGGEDYDWYYASAAARTAQSRTPISDGAYGKPWVYRAKDFWNWWANHHYDRPGGVENAVATAWVPGSKPIWFTELGCPAVDKGANQPNVFYDPKSVESALPYFSNGERDDLIQRRFLEAHFGFWSSDANNPAADAYAGRMVDAQNIYVWTWDARPYPFFPAREDIWGDAPNYKRGHWLNGRLGAVFLPDLVEALCAYSQFTDADVANLSGLVTGFAVTSTMATRDALAPLGLAYHFDAVESEGRIKFVARGRPAAVILDEEDFALGDHENGFGYSVHRAQETDLPAVSRISYVDGENDYRDAVSEARRLVGHSQRVAQSQLPLVLDQGQAIGIGERLLLDAWVMRETVDFALPPAHLSLDPADEIVLQTNGRTRRLRLTQIDDGPSRQMQAVATDPSVYERLVGPARIGTNGSGANVVHAGRASVTFLDLPLLSGDENPYAPHVAAYAQPWPGEVAIYKSATDANYTRDTALTAPAILGVTTEDFAAGPLWRWDNVNVLRVRLFGGTLAAQDDLAVLGGANALALETADGEWEVLQFQAAALSGANIWALSRLLRGQAGTESAMRDVVSAGARIVVLNAGVKQLALTADNYALPFHYLYGPAGKPLSDPAYQTLAKQFSGIGLRPFAPVHLRAALQANDDVALSWTRRGRVNADSWAQTEIPLGEESESYAIDILNGADIVRTLNAASAQVLYTAADQLADFGVLPASISFSVSQISAAFGRGVSTRKTCHVR